MNDGDQTAALSPSHSDDLAGQLWAFDEFSADDRRPADLGTGLSSVGFVRAALRRSVKFWCTAAVIGLLVGLGIFVARPPSYQASASILLTNNPNEQPSEAMLDNQVIAQSRTVAEGAVKKLGLRQTALSFTSDYTVTALTGRVLLVTVRATSSDAAVREANAVAQAFLAFQGQDMQAQDQRVKATLQQQVSQAQAGIAEINRQITRVSAQPPSAARSDALDRLRDQLTQANATLAVTEQTYRGSEANMRATTAQVVKGSRVLDTARPIPQSRLKLRIIYAVTGLLIGLALGAGIVVVRALVSDKLLRRDDVSRALGAPVKLSVGKVRVSRWWPGRSESEVAQSPAIRRTVAHLDHEVPPSWGGLASLAIVPVDEAKVPAICLVALATSCAQRGFQVVMADLASGFPAARLLGVTRPGVQQVSTDGAHLVVAVPDPDDVAPVGPLARRSGRAQSAEPLADACASADLLLTLAPLDPALGAGHLPGWARGAVAVVTAGRSSVARAQAVGEMIRMAGIDQFSAVLVGADKTDESLGVVDPPPPAAQEVPRL